MAGTSIAAAILAEAALRPVRRAVPHAAPVVRGARVTPVSIRARDDALLRAWLFTPDHANGSAVLALHGIADNRTSMTGIASVLATHGYVVVAADARAHGESEGALATYGVREADDVRRWAAWVRARSAGCVYGFGESLGASLLLQALPSSAPFCAVVAESAFASFSDVAIDRVRQRLPLPDRVGRMVAAVVARLGMLYVRIRYGVDLTAASSVDALTRARVPLLLIHGTADALAPVSYGEQLRSVDPDATLWVVPGATHTQAWAAAGHEFPRRVVEFFEANGPRR